MGLPLSTIERYMNMSDDIANTGYEQARYSHRPSIKGTTGMVVSGHALASLAGMRILDRDGNAIDAGVAAGICLGVLQSDMVNFAGVAPIMIYSADTRQVKTISGLGPWPRAASVEFFQDHFKGQIPEGIERTVVPGAPDAWIQALRLYGTMSFEQVSRDSISLAKHGFPMHHFMSHILKGKAPSYGRWPTNARIYLPNGRAPEPGEIFIQRDLAGTIQILVEAERRNLISGRDAALQAARDEFYRGRIAESILDFHAQNGGLLHQEDLRDFQVAVEDPLKTTYKEYEIFSCRPWCQGPAFLQALNILEKFDLKALDHNSAEYIHLVTEALKLVFADREKYYGDPGFVDVPIAGLLSKEYAITRRDDLNRAQAWREMPPAGNPWLWQDNAGKAPGANDADPAPTPAKAVGTEHLDTSYVCVVDRRGNIFSATPSDVSYSTPIIPPTGLAVSSRGSQSWVDPGHPSSIQGGKRPRLTPNPCIVFKDGEPVMPIGTPGGDTQCQSMLQVFMNIVEFGMEPQVAVEAPRFATFNFPNSFFPHDYHPGLLKVEGRIHDSALARLKDLGHRIETWADWSWKSGAVCLIHIGSNSDVLIGAADPRRESYALGW